jgi:type I restriction enzyme R subunit
VAAATSLNFSFLASHDPVLAVLGAQAERRFADDPIGSLVKLRQLTEQLAQRAAAQSGVYATSGQDSQLDLLRRLQTRGTLPRSVADLFHSVRKAGNLAAHDLRGDQGEALQQLKVTWQIAIWFHRTFGHAKGFQPGPFVPPVDRSKEHDELAGELARLKGELDKAKVAGDQAKALAEQAAREKLSAEERAKKEAEERAVWEQLAADAEKRFAEQLDVMQKQATAKPKQVQQLVEKAEAAATHVALDEVATRKLIDAQLRAAGWEVDTAALSYAQGVRPTKNRNFAIAEWPATDVKDGGKSGRADYALFCGLEAIAVVEAKRDSKSVSSVIDSDAKGYARSLTLDDQNLHPSAPWGKYRVPFLFATNGRPFLRQLQEQSGVWFLDGRKNTNHPRALEGWFRPEELTAMLKLDFDAAVEALRHEPTDILGLRDFQREAIRKVEEAIGKGQRAIMLAMATGTGKTRTAIALAYRLLKTKTVRRILFIVDRESLGEQAQDAFKDARIETGRTFADIYELKELRDLKPEGDTKVHFATIQGMVRRALSPSDDEQAPSVGQYDCIIIDECHRGYTLDQELSESELGFRDQEEYKSLYRRALDHFDAIKIGLTATPALHTREIFGKPVFEYSYRRAVVEGVLVDHEPPTRIVTKLAKDGIRWKAGEEMEVLDTRTGAIDKVKLPDDVGIDIEGFNKQVVTEGFNRAVCGRLAEHLDPMLDAKTLVFAANDDHADLVVRLLKEAFAAKGTDVDDDAIVKITGASVQKRPKLIKLYKNERYPNIAVTVDLLTTGIDVPKICNLVFLRRVRSRILYEQMLGRATRTCDAIGKDVFRIYDAVDLYRDMQKYTDMKPVVAKPQLTFEQLIREAVTVETKHKKTVVEQLVAKLQRKIPRLAGEALEVFETIAGMSPKALVAKLQGDSPNAVAQWLATKPELARVLDRKTDGSYALPVSHHADHVLHETRGYGEGQQRPADYLESFSKFVKDNLNKIPALLVVTQRPRDLTRKELRALKAALDGAGYTEVALKTAWRDTTDADVAASIIGYVRQAALGDPLVPYEQRVDRALEKMTKRNKWTDAQRGWLKRIAKQLKIETILDRTSFDEGQFKSDGGAKHIDKVFGGKLDSLLSELRASIWEDAG